jgi:anthranilate synthase/phosphoribosyltransferase
MYLLIDNYDSFTYNLYQYIVQISGKEVEAVRNDRIEINGIEKMAPEGIILSPGPGRPENAGICVDLIKHFAGRIPILGVCLGHQAIGHAFGATISGARNIVHGKTDDIFLDGKGLFRNIPSPARFTRYHSLVVKRDTLPQVFEITATSSDGEIMGIRHKSFILEGIQFHPESIASENGKKVLKNFLSYKLEPFNIAGGLEKILSGENLSQDEAEFFMEELTNGELTNAQIAAFLIAFNSKPVTSYELAGLASVLQRRKKSISFQRPLLDTCGTGGDGKGSFNISSMAAVIAASCGACIAKHGNRGVSSRSGSADFYRCLGIEIDLSPEKAVELLANTNFSFLFAPIYHSSMKHAAQVRRELGIKTVMNLMGPLVNPADADHQLIGVFSEDLCLPMAQAAKLLGKKRVMVVHGLDGFDEISVSAPTKVVEIDEKEEVREYTLDPQDLGLELVPVEELEGGTPEENARIAVDILHSRGRPALIEAVLLNAGAALYVYEFCESIEEGYRKAKEALESGRVEQKLNQIREESVRLK